MTHDGEWFYSAMTVFISGKDEAKRRRLVLFLEYPLS